jgi:ethanolamine transporter EutH
MNRIIVICGLISGVIVSTFMIASMAVCYQKESFDGNMLLGYAAMLLSFSMVFVGIKSYRDKYSNGSVSFGKAFKIGLYITLVASTVYVVVWLIDYYLFIPDFMDKYTAHLLKQFQSEGPTAAELEAKVVELAEYKEMYQSPLMVILWTYAEILPVGLVVALISALILKKPGAAVRPA